MSDHPDSEEALEAATIQLLTELGWGEWADCVDEPAIGCQVSGRETRAEVLLTDRLRSALERLNPDLPSDAIASAIEELYRGRATMSIANANREVYRLLKEGVRVETSRHDAASGQEIRELATVRVIDWDDPANNDLFLAQQLWITGEFHTRRADLLGFVNGLPLLLIELKKPSVDVRHAFDDNLCDYKDTIPHLFWYNGVVVLSNGSDARLGSLTASWDHFGRWKKINSEGEEGIIALDTLLRATCTPDRLLDLVENYTLFSEGRGGVNKIVAKNHQYLGVENALAAVAGIKENRGRLGVFWHTQGSGKSYSMIFFGQKSLRKLPGNWTFVIITDRRDLDDQIYKNFAAAGVVTEAEKSVRAQSGEHLQQLLQEDHRYLFSLIQKFHIERGKTYPVLSERDDIIVITDEAHRSQYDILAQNMRNALPNAAFIGFTGTPLMAGEELTKEVFGEYVSIYNFKQSIDDEATVSLFYENRIPEVQIINEQFDKDLERLLEEAELDEAQEARLTREFAREYHIITRDDRLDKIAVDIVEHFLGRGYWGKAMVVSIDKVTVGLMYARVRDHWNQHLAILKADLDSNPDEWRRAELEEEITFMEQTDMALVVSQGQNEIQQFQEKGLDIRPHRARMNSEALDEHFKNPNHPLRIVFVCAMWMTGFDVPNCSTIYLDKPMRNHTLMQTIARANRVYKGKNNGLIVDYIGVFRNLQEALAIYGSSSGGSVKEGETPIKSKEALIDDLRSAIGEADQFCQEHGIDIEAIAAADSFFSRIKLVEEAVDAVLVDDDTKNAYLALADLVERLFKAILPDRRANEFFAIRAAFKAIAEVIRRELEPPDISGVMEEVEDLLDRSIAGFRIFKEAAEAPFDLGKIDFDALREQFKKGHKRTEAMKLRGKLNSKLMRMVRLNKLREELVARLQQLIEEYNAGRIDVDLFFEKLLAFAGELREEEQRGIAENLSEEELAVYDLLLKPRPELTDEEIDQVKEVARDMLDTLKAERLILDWRKQQQARAAVRQAIEESLDRLPAAYDVTLYKQKCERVYSHIYDNYFGRSQSTYTRLALAA